MDDVLERVAALGIELRRSQALDFGCGVGRLTQSLCKHFEQCCGVDIAPSMLRLAQQRNRYGMRCRYELNVVPNLRLFPDGAFDFIYSSLVLQHMPTRRAKGYIREFLRVLAPCGCLVFRLPSHPRQALPYGVRVLLWGYWLCADSLIALRQRRVQPRMEMYGMAQQKVGDLITGEGGEIRAICPDDSAGPDWISFLYVVTKPAPGRL